MARKVMTYIRDSVKIVDPTEYLDDEFKKYNQEFSVFVQKVKANKGIEPNTAVMYDMPKSAQSYYAIEVEKLRKCKLF